SGVGSSQASPRASRATPQPPTNERVIGLDIPRKSLAWAAFSGELGTAGQRVGVQIRLTVELGDPELDPLVLSGTRRIGVVRDGLRLAESNRQQTTRVDAVGEQPLLHGSRALTRECQALL